MKESKSLEYKSDISNTFLKTVSAFANYGTGKIQFGINDNGCVCGLKNPTQECLNIENKINDSLSPVPKFDLEINNKNNVISLTVYEGNNKPYFYKNKAYKRSDTSTIEVDALELKRLVLLGSNMYYEQLPYTETSLSFDCFENKVMNILGISKLTENILRTFGLYTKDEGFNIAAALIADKNNFSGIDIVRFGDTISIILDRDTFAGISIFKQYDKSLEFYKKYYQYEEIEGSTRQLKELIPEDAFREAIANALVHRTWDINSHIRIMMFSDRIEVISPGGLPAGINEKEYLNGYVSTLRNPIIGNIFFRLKYIEMFGTGIRRINEAYKDYAKQPSFKITDNSITVILPILKETYSVNTEEEKVIQLLTKGKKLSSQEVSKQLGYSKGKAIRILDSLLSNDYIIREGNARSTRYLLK